MRNVFLGAILVGILTGVAVVAVRAASNRSSPAPSDSVAQVTPTPDPGSPRDTAAAFAAALEIRDIDALYDLLDDDSRFDRTLDDIEAAYSYFFNETTTTAVATELGEVSETGATVSVTLSTAYFDDIEYAIPLTFTRTADDEYRIAWTPAAIHPDLREGRRIQSDIKRPSRGAIYDRNGEPLAHTVDRRYVGLNRAVIDDRAAVTQRLLEFGFTREDIDSAFDSPIPANQRVGVGIVDESRYAEADQLVLDTTGVLIYAVSERVHPLGPATAHVVGYTREVTAEELESLSGQGYRPGDRVGATGIERVMNSRLAGQVGAELTIVDQSGALISQLAEREFVDGADVNTTLDAAILQATQARLGDRRGAAVVIEPDTNGILALNSSPTFDPNAFEQNDYEAITRIASAEGSPQANRAEHGLYSAGSVFKLVTGAAGLMSGLYSTTDTLQCGATWDTFDPPRRNWEGAQGPLTIAQGLMRSCNPVFYEIAYQLYNQAEEGYLSDVARKFGFGAASGSLGLSDEDGLVPDAEWKREARNEPWYPGDEVNLGIGQGDLLITPLQLANAYSAFVNQRLRAPILIQGDEAEERGELGLTPAQHAHLLEGLKLVTSPSGTAAGAYAGYSNFAGKSGTAEDANEQQHVLFAAFYPADNPIAVAAVVLDDGDSGSREAGPMARDMLLAAADAR